MTTSIIKTANELPNGTYYVSKFGYSGFSKLSKYTGEVPFIELMRMKPEQKRK